MYVYLLTFLSMYVCMSTYLPTFRWTETQLTQRKTPWEVDAQTLVESERGASQSAQERLEGKRNRRKSSRAWIWRGGMMLRDHTMHIYIHTYIHT